METAFRLFMYIFPYAISIALYIWFFRRTKRVSQKIQQTIARIIVIAGLGYTLYHMVTTISKALINDHFHFVVLLATVFALFFASIAMAFGEPDK